MIRSHDGPHATLWVVLDRFLAGEMPPDELGQWLRRHDELRDLLTPAELDSLRSIWVEAGGAASAARQLVARIYESHRPGKLPHDRAARIARGMIEGSINSAAGTRALARLRQEGHAWIPDAFVGIAAMLDDLPHSNDYVRSDPRALAQRLTAAKKRERACRAPALTAAHRLLESLAANDAEPRD